jgi:hypothetical protein
MIYYIGPDLMSKKQWPVNEQSHLGCDHEHGIKLYQAPPKHSLFKVLHVSLAGKSKSLGKWVIISFNDSNKTNYITSIIISCFYYFNEGQ